MMPEVIDSLGPVLIVRMPDGGKSQVRLAGIADNAAALGILIPLTESVVDADTLGARLVADVGEPTEETLEQTGEKERLLRRLAVLVDEEAVTAAEQARAAICAAACERLNALLKRREDRP